MSNLHEKVGFEDGILTQKNPPAFPVPRETMFTHSIAINNKSVEGYPFSVECSCSWRMHASSMEEAEKKKKLHAEGRL